MSRTSFCVLFIWLKIRIMEEAGNPQIIEFSAWIVTLSHLLHFWNSFFHHLHWGHSNVQRYLISGSVTREGTVLFDSGWLWRNSLSFCFDAHLWPSFIPYYHLHHLSRTQHRLFLLSPTTPGGNCLIHATLILLVVAAHQLCITPFIFGDEASVTTSPSICCTRQSITACILLLEFHGNMSVQHGVISENEVHPKPHTSPQCPITELVMLSTPYLW